MCSKSFTDREPKIRRSLRIILLTLAVVILLSLIAAYTAYLKWEESVVPELAWKATAFIGQKVEIEDLSFHPLGGIILSGVRINNPDTFQPGRLLKIKKLSLRTRWRELLKGRLPVTAVTVYSPELTVIKNEKGELNISKEIREFFKGESRFNYDIEDLTIRDGIFDFQGDGRFRNTDIDFTLENLSSRQGTKTLIEGATHLAGGRVNVAGWAYLKDDPRRVELSVTPEKIDLSAISDAAKRYEMQAAIEKVTLRGEMHKDGETEVTAAMKTKIAGSGRYPLDGALAVDISIGSRFDINRFKETISGEVALSSGEAVFKGVRVGALSGRGTFDHRDFYLKMSLPGAFGGTVDTSVKGKSQGGPFPMELKLMAQKIDMRSVRQLAAAFVPVPYDVSGVVEQTDVEGILSSRESFRGKASVKTAGMTVAQDGKKILTDASVQTRIDFLGKDLKFEINARTGKLYAQLSGDVRNFAKTGRAAAVRVSLPAAEIAAIRESFWDVFPDALLYAGLEGSISSDLIVSHRRGDLTIQGALTLNNVAFRGENDEYEIGPIDGSLPISYGKSSAEKLPVPMFERSGFEKIQEDFLQKKSANGYSTVTMRTVRYGFRIIQDLSLRVQQKGSVFNIGRFSGTVFGGRLQGVAVLDVSDGLSYRAGMLIKGLSLTELCREIEPIKGYLSGKVDGVANLKGETGGITNLIGKADFWTYSTKAEDTKISREFLQKIGGPSLKTYIGDRRFDKGIMNVYLQDGYIVFREFELSNRNILGIVDLSIKVAPFSNRIAIDHLLWTIAEAAQRAKEKR
ncbi:MAG: AsmA family protein [Nitrospirota bacterium]